MFFPPRNGSPQHALTVLNPSFTSTIEISNVPPPKSKIKIGPSSFISYTVAAANGSFTILINSIPAILTAFTVANISSSLKVAGMPTTAFIL